MSRQSEIDRIAPLLEYAFPHIGDGMKNACYIVAGYLVDNGIRSKDGFEVDNSKNIEYEAETGDIQAQIQPKQYKEVKDARSI